MRTRLIVLLIGCLAATAVILIRSYLWSDHAYEVELVRVFDDASTLDDRFHSNPGEPYYVVSSGGWFEKKLGIKLAEKPQYVLCARFRLKGFSKRYRDDRGPELLRESDSHQKEAFLYSVSDPLHYPMSGALPIE